VLTWFHGDEVPSHPRLARLAARSSDTTIAVSRYTRDVAIRVGVSRERLAVIPPGVDLPPDGAPARAPDPRPTLLTVARLTDRYKGHDVMIDALGRLRAEEPDVHWVVVGDGPLRAELEQRTRAAGLSANVTFLGAVDDATRDAWFARAHVFAMPSRLPPGGAGGEGFGIAYLEAAARGVPSVAGRVAGAVDAVVDGETGVLVDPTDAAAVAGAIGLLLREPERARRLGEAARERAVAFAWPAIAARVDALLESHLRR
jgi:phosphatidylinositol alpha-1,6-mannosyltransferase